MKHTHFFRSAALFAALGLVLVGAGCADIDSVDDADDVVDDAMMEEKGDSMVKPPVDSVEVEESEPTGTDEDAAEVEELLDQIGDSLDSAEANTDSVSSGGSVDDYELSDDIESVQ